MKVRAFSIDIGVISMRTSDLPNGGVASPVFENLDGNGIEDAADTGLAGVAVTVTDGVNHDVVTDGSGDYSLTLLPVGDAKVTYSGSTGYVRFFNGPHSDDIDWYSDPFADAGREQKAGEATPWYLHDPAAVQAMQKIVPDAQIIVILCDPVDRTYSHFWMERIRGRADGSFEEFIDSSDVLGISRYADHLTYLTRYFPRDRVLIVFHHDLEREPAGLYTQVCDFLGVDASYAPLTLSTTVNQYVEFRSLRVRGWAKSLPTSFAGVRKTLDRLNTRTSVSYPPMRPETRERLAAYY